MYLFWNDTHWRTHSFQKNISCINTKDSGVTSTEIDMDFKTHTFNRWAYIIPKSLLFIGIYIHALVLT